MSLDNKETLDFLEDSQQINIKKEEDATSTKMSEFDRREKEAYIRLQEGYVADSEQDREQRKDFANKIFAVTVRYLFFVCFVVFLTGLECLKYHEAILITFLSTTTINIISLFVIVARYLFPTKRKS